MEEKEGNLFFASPFVETFFVIFLEISDCYQIYDIQGMGVNLCFFFSCISFFVLDTDGGRTSQSSGKFQV